MTSTSIVFTPGMPARENFYGRDEELQAVFQQSWTWFCGQRRIGKTSVLYRVEQEATRRGALPLFLNLAVLPGTEASGEGLFRTFFRSHRQRCFEPRGLTLERFLGIDPAESFFELVQTLSADGTDILFLWDEAERLLDVEHNDPGFLMRLRARLEGCTQFRIVISATQMMSALVDGSKEFLSAYRWQPLCGLDDEDAQALLRCDHTGGWASPLADEIVEQAVRWSGGHPLMLQTLGTSLAEAVRNEGRRVDRSLLRNCSTRLLANQTLRDIFVDDFQRLTPVQQSLLRMACARQEGLDLEGGALKIHAEEVGCSSFALEDAAAILASYGYVTWNGRLRLRFSFYGNLLPESEGLSHTQEQHFEHVRRTVFISYSHKDDKLLDRLMVQLTPLTRSHKRNIDLWHDRQIVPGKTWEKEIRTALRRARIAVLLISPDFLASEFIDKVELPYLLCQAESGGCQILCLYLKHTVAQDARYLVDGKECCLTDFQGLNKPDQPLDTLSGPQQNGVLAESARYILRLLTGLET